MDAPRGMFALLACLLLAGCSLRGGESREEIDRDEYGGGAGLAIALRNHGRDPFDVNVTVLGAGNVVAASLVQTLAPGQAVEKWWTLERSTYSVRMAYVWDAESGRASSGGDEKTVDLEDCPLVSRVSWSFDQQADQVGSTDHGKTCVAAEE